MKPERHRGPIRVSILCAVLFAGCSSGVPDRDAARPDVVLIVIDTLRADHLPSYGYRHDTAPFLRELAESGVVYEQCYAPSSWTAPSTASLFTSVLPNQHGVTMGDRYYRPGRVDPPPVRINRIPVDLVTIPEVFRDAGYRTYAITDNYFISEVGGFSRGFDRFVQYDYRTADAVNALLMKWKREILDDEEPYFLYLHYVDPHWPYHPRDPWYVDSGSGSESIRAYDSEIHYVDDRIRQVSEAFGWDENTLLIVTSDHGEEFSEHGDEGHRFKLYQELLHVPLFIRFPAAAASASRVAGAVSLIDLLPTLRAWLALPADEQDMGISLLPSVHGESVPDRAIFAMRTKEADVLLEDKVAVIRGNEKLILTRPDGVEELYELSIDPTEQTNRATAAAATSRDLRRIIDAFEQDARVYPREFVDLGTLSPEQRERLRSLGYVH